MLFSAPTHAILAAIEAAYLAGSDRLRLTAESGVIVVECSSPTSSTRYRLPDQSPPAIKRPGSCIVQPTTFANQIRSIPAASISLSATEHYLTITQDNLTSDARLQIPLEPEPPTQRVPSFGSTAPLRLHVGELSSLIDRVVFACLKTKRSGVTSPRCGVRVELDERSLTLTATDGPQLATISAVHSPGMDSGTRPWSGIVPAHVLRSWSKADRAAKRLGYPTTLAFGAGVVGFSCGQLESWTKCIDGDLPLGWRAMLAVRPGCDSLTVSAHELRLRLPKLLKASPQEPWVQFELGGDLLALRVNGDAVVEDAIEGVEWIGEETTITLNGQRLLRWLESLGDEAGSVRLEVQEDDRDGAEPGGFAIGSVGDGSGKWMVRYVKEVV